MLKLQDLGNLERGSCIRGYCGALEYMEWYSFTMRVLCKKEEVRDWDGEGRKGQWHCLQDPDLSRSGE